MTDEEFITQFPKTNTFQVLRAQTMPHVYCVPEKLVGFISTNFAGKLTREGIEAYEKHHGPSCTVEGCTKTIQEHILALVVEIVDDGDDPLAVPGLQEYLESIVGMAEAGGCKGFVYQQKKPIVIEPVKEEMDCSPEG